MELNEIISEEFKLIKRLPTVNTNQKIVNTVSSENNNYLLVFFESGEYAIYRRKNWKTMELMTIEDLKKDPCIILYYSYTESNKLILHTSLAYLGKFFAENNLIDMDNIERVMGMYRRYTILESNKRAKKYRFDPNSNIEYKNGRYYIDRTTAVRI